MAAIFALAGCATVDPGPAPGDIVILPYVERFADAPPGDGRPGGWEPWTIARFKKPTEYDLVSYDGRPVIRAHAKSSASGLVHRVDIDPRRYPLLHWHWKVGNLIDKADNRRRHTEDSPVRIVVSFAGDMDKLDFDDRIFFSQVKAFTGQELPYATLMYIWENRAPRGTIIPNPHTSRIKMVVAETGKVHVGRWREETRNVYEDFKQAFGEEPGRIIAVAIMSDTDNTREDALAYYGDITFKRIAPPRASLASD